MITKATEPLDPEPPDTTEAELIARAQRGEREAFGELYLLHRGAVFRFIRRRTQDRALAEDLTADVFLRAVAKLDTFTYGTSLIAWLITIARHVVADYYKRADTRRLTYLADIADFQFEPVEAAEDTALAHLALAELDEAITRLRPSFAAVLRLRFLQDRTVPEAAAVLGRGVGATKTLQFRAVRALRAAYLEATA
ncbi:RNA polymerase sigma factor [Streptomyces sp. NPDC003656]